ncbi:bacteriohemerythrin [Rhodospira trueperi]|uniref:Hemerythrin-like metal-binding domain protein n=1 Tax=Rhodospira trueperi TaxID=69960 RepID=A0A1G7HBF0_9PROT|nr:bacteriohemerythrin [Rhodospira trueperi]SDE97696.1 hemerythrin-like metal-binding domain protein [Rhodospira trueperi]
MAYVNWGKDLETGIDLIDRDHRVLVDLLNQAYDCIGAEEEASTLGSVLNTLVDYTQYHFAREERLMQAAGFPELALHREMHQKLSQRARESRSEYLRNPGSVNAREVMEFLRSWLIDHILKQDFRYRSAVIEHPEAMREAAAISFDAVPDSMAPPANQDQAPGPAPLDFSSMSVLVLDDNQNFQVILRTILKGLGCPSITLVDDAHQGLAALAEAVPTLILVDWRMDGMDGLEFVREARGRGVTTPIVMISGYGEPGFSEMAKAAGVDAFLEKPITALKLVQTAARALAER